MDLENPTTVYIIIATERFVSSDRFTDKLRNIKTVSC